MSSTQSQPLTHNPCFKEELSWQQEPVSNQRWTETSVLIIGGGISGMCIAIKLLNTLHVKKLLIIEKGGGFGGTWRDNKFPGCCCDVFSELYSFSFEQNPNWTRKYPSQVEILDYLTEVATKHRLYKYARFNSTVESARWNQANFQWETTVSVNGGKDSEFSPSYTIISDIVVACTGQLNSPKGLSVPGIEEFEGKVMHTSRWDWSYDLVGKRIAIVGTGATAAQVVPQVAKVADHLTVCQRTPAWVIPRRDSEIPRWKRLLYNYFPPLLWRSRAEAMDFREKFHTAVTRSDSQHADNMRKMNDELLKNQLWNRPDLQSKLIPRYSPGCKRTIISDDYYPALGRNNVILDTSRIEHFTRNGIKFADHDRPTDFDLIILATGFSTFSFLSEIIITGRNGCPLEEIWTNTPQAYKGITVPELPNFSILYGPGTNLSHNSLILVIEAQSNYVTALVKVILEAKARGKTLALRPSPQLTAAYCQQLQDALQKTSFADRNCTSWWRREDGQIVNNWAGTAVEYQKNLEILKWDDYIADGSAAGEFQELIKRQISAKIGRVREETVLSRHQWALLLSGVGAIAAHVWWTW